ncbi:hypothetical protein EG834_04160 [bacterium]|nr:hypothetical protein [bacterium]
MPRYKHQSLLSVLIIIAAVMLAACSTATPTLDPTPTTGVIGPTATTPPMPLGDPSNPILIGYVLNQDDPQSQAAIESLVQELDQRIGLTFGAVIFPTYEQMLDMLKAGNVHGAWLQPLTYIYASSQGLVDVQLLTNHFGTYYYGTQFLANVENGFTTYFDSQTNTATSDAETALRQLDGRRPCWTEEGSISGHIYPLGILQGLNINPLPGAIVQSHTAVIRSLYIKGICDYGVTFAYSGDPRTSSAVINDLPDVDQKVIVLWQSPPDIPNLNFSTIPSLPDPIRAKLVSVLVDLIKTDEGKALLTQANNAYDVQDLGVVDDSVYEPLRQTVRRSGITITDFLGR